MQSWPAVQVHAAEAAVPRQDVGDKEAEVHSNRSLQQTVLQQQADICRLESELAAMQHRFQHMGRSVTCCPYLPSPGCFAPTCSLLPLPALPGLSPSPWEAREAIMTCPENGTLESGL